MLRNSVAVVAVELEKEDIMNNEVRGELIACYSLGFLDELKGSPIDEDDEIDNETADEIESEALVCISKAEWMIEMNYAENPQQVHGRLYLAGRESARQKETLWMQRN